MQESAQHQSKFRRIRKEDAQVIAPQKRDGLSVCLSCWRLYMQSEDKALGASRMKLECGTDEDSHYGYESDPYGEQHKADLRIGEATNAMISDLKPAHTWAITKSNGITTVWKFPSVDYIKTLAAAHAALEDKLRRNLSTATQFD